MRSRLAVALGLMLLGAAPEILADNCPVALNAAPRDINIPAQSLGLALQALAAQTGIDILFESSVVAGMQAEEVRGRLLPGEVLCRLLKGSGLDYRINTDRTIIIRKPSGASRTASRIGGWLSFASDAAFADQDARPPGDGDADADQSPANDLTQVVVTGTRRADRTAGELAVPMDVIGGEILQSTGSTDTNKALAALVPSFNFPQPAITGGTDLIRPATLRGLGPDQTLVLVNGKRRHVSALLNINGSVGRGSAAVDMSMLPTIAIQRIEVLRDGAAAQYGSDAIAGVINLLLEDKPQGGRFSLTYGQHYTTIDGVREATGIVTQPNGQPVMNPDGTFALQYGDERQPHDGETLTLAGNFGLPLGDGGFLNLSAQARDRMPTNRAGYDPRRQYHLLASGNVDTREFQYNRLSERFGEADVEDFNVVVNSGMPLASGAIEWYGFGTYGLRDGQTNGFYRLANDPRVVTALFPDGFLAQVKIDLDDLALATGARGELRGWNYDASVNFGRNRLDFVTANSNNASLGVKSPTSFDAGGLGYKTHSANIDLQRDVTVAALEKPLSVAFGAEFRHENFAVRAGEPASYIQGPVRLPNGQLAAAGAQVFPGFRPDNATDRSRHSTSAYLDLEADLTSRWTLDLAGRAERYSDFGSDVNYKLASRFQLLDGVAVRGGVSTGFRAPSLHQQFFSTTSTNNVGGRLVDVGTFAVTDGAARALGARDLEPETSFNLSAGFVFNLLDRFDITLDYYRIDIDDRIVLTENLGTGGTPAQNAAVQAVLAAAGFPSISGARFFINGIDTQTQGVDAVATYQAPSLGIGDFRLTAGYNYTETEIQRFINELGPLAQIPGLELFGRLESERIERGQPRTKLALAVEWSKGAWSTTLRANRYGEVFAPGADPRDDLIIAPAWVTDLDVAFSVSGLKLSLGVENLFDSYPDAAPTGVRPAEMGGNYTLNNYVLPFSGFTPFGFSGRFIYGRASYQF